MANYTISATSGTITAKLVVTEKSQSTENNQTELSWALYMWNTGTLWYAYDTKNTFNVVIGGVTVWNTSSYGLVSLANGMSESAAVLMGSGTTTVTHDADGSKVIPIYFRAAQEWQNPPLYLWTASGNFTLTTIARASQPSCITYPQTTDNVGDLGTSIYIHTNRASSNFTHIVRYVWGKQSGIIAENVTDNCIWQIPLSLANEIPSSTSGRGTIYVDTYFVSTFIGTKSVNFTATVPSSIIPTISGFKLSPINSNSVVNGWGIFLKDLSRMKVEWTAAGAYSSKIAYYVISYNGVVSNVSSGYTSPVFTKSGTVTIYYKAVDTRGRTTPDYSQTFTVYDYASPQISIFNASRLPNSTQTVSVYSLYSISSANKKNAIKTLTLQYRKTGGTWATYNGALPSGNSVQIVGFAEDSSYEIKLTLTDSVGNTATKTVYVGTAAVLLDFRAGGKGFSVGKISEKDAFEIGMNAHYYQRVRLDKGFGITSSVGKQGTSCWVCIAQIVIQSTYFNFPLEFTVARRGIPEYSRLTLVFKNEDSTDPDVSSFTYSGGIIDAVIKKTDTSTWKLYINKAEAYDSIFLADVKNNWDNNTITITYPTATISDSKPTGGTDAIPIIKYDGANLSLLNNTISLSSAALSLYDGVLSIAPTGMIKSKSAVYSGLTDTYAAVCGTAKEYGWLSLYDVKNNAWLNEIALYKDKTSFNQILEATKGMNIHNELELFADTPHIDFHFGNSTTDYTARIIENAQGTLTAYNSISSASDKRLKKDISDIPDSYIEFVEKLIPHIYRFQNGSEYLNAGLIAQEVMELEKECGIKESVLVRGTGKEIEVNGKKMIDYYSIDYNALLILLLKYTTNKIQEMEALLKERDKS